MRSLAILGLVAVAGAANAQFVTVTQWNFNGESTATVPGGPTSPAPSFGNGTAILIGGTTGTFASGTASGGSSDPVTTTPPNYAWNTTAYPAQGTLSGVAGVQFNVSTVGFEGIRISFDTRHSNTASAWLRLDYTTDGMNWTNGPSFNATSGDAWFNNRMADLSGNPLVDNNPNFAFRIVTVFAPGTSGFVASNPTGTYSPNGTLRYDMVTVEAVPEPASMAALALGVGGLLARRRRR
jgi:hypothetical protein